MSFVYKARPADSWTKRAKQSGSQYEGFISDSFSTFSPKKENWVRILPPTWDNAQHYGLDVWVHYGTGPDKASVLCLNKMSRERCPICEAQAKAENAGREDAKQFKPSRRVAVWVLDRNEEKEPLVWAMPWTVDREISMVSKDRQTGEIYQIDHPEAGYDVMFNREGEGMNVKYVGTQIARKPSSVKSTHLDYITKNPIPNVLNWRDYDEVQALFEGGAQIDPSTVGTVQKGPDPSQYTETVVSPPPTTVVDFCDKTFMFKGTRLGCSLQLGHDGAPDTCNFERELAAQVSGTNGGASLETSVVPISQPATPPSKAAAMRERFKTGQQNK